VYTYNFWLSFKHLTPEDKLISILRKSPADQYSIYRKLNDIKMSDILSAIAKLEKEKKIHVINHRRSERTGLNVPIYSISTDSQITNRLNIDSLLAGVCTERLIEYPFLDRNLISTNLRATILDIGSAPSSLTKTVSKFGNAMWRVVGIDINRLHDIEGISCFTFYRMDSRKLGFCDEVFDQVICISTVEHIGVVSEAYDIHQEDDQGDIKMMSEIHRVLKKGGTLVLTLPYGKTMQKREYRIYNQTSLARLISEFSVIKKEFYQYDNGIWKECVSESEANNMANNDLIPSYLHSNICLCLLLKKQKT
jgi:SAM-dependent methyltransferase